MLSRFQYKKKCCKPLSSKKCSKHLRVVQNWMFEKCSSIRQGDHICDSCRNALYKKPVVEIPYDESLEGSNDDTYRTSDTVFEALNTFLTKIDESPVTKKKLRTKKYGTSKLLKIENLLKTNVFNMVPPLESDDITIMEQLKAKFRSSTDQKEKLTILTLVPKSWPTTKIIKEFEGCTKYMAMKSRELLESSGILASPTIKHGKSLSNETVNMVNNFYESDEVSRLMPGKKDFVSVKGVEGRVHVQKRLILGNLKELYKCYKEQNEQVKIGFSKFASLRPKNCVLAGASGTHSVCVCTLHQNPKLMLEACKGNFSKTDSSELFSDYHILLNKIICVNPTKKCYFNECKSCPGVQDLKQQLKTLFDSCNVEQVIFKQWVSTDRSTLETLIKSSEEFIDELLEALTNLLRHSYISKQQSKYFKDLKENLPFGFFIIICDFAQNYSFVIQDEIQGFHWNNEQATLHPFVYYYKDETGDLKSGSYVAMSDCRKHDTVLFYLFQKQFINFLKKKHNNIAKVIYFTDGCGGQYKNFKNFLNITYHEEDFGIPAEWNFFATSHGKGACDGVGGTVKRLAARASLQRPYNDQITTPYELYTWSKANLSNINFEFFTNENYQLMDHELKNRFEQAKTVNGTLQIHSVVPVDKGVISTKAYSYDTSSTQRKFLKKIPKMKLEIKPLKRLQLRPQHKKLNNTKKSK